MKFSEAYEYHKQGKKIRRKDWNESIYLDEQKYSDIRIDCVLANDWEVVDEKDNNPSSVDLYHEGYSKGFSDSCQELINKLEILLNSLRNSK